MVKMTKTQARRRLKEAMSKIDRVWLASIESNHPHMSIMEMSKIDTIIQKYIKKLK